MRVDLPDPFWPTRACTSPAATSMSTASRASVPGKALVMPLMFKMVCTFSRFLNSTQFKMYR